MTSSQPFQDFRLELNKITDSMHRSKDAWLIPESEIHILLKWLNKNENENVILGNDEYFPSLRSTTLNKIGVNCFIWSWEVFAVNSVWIGISEFEYELSSYWPWRLSRIRGPRWIRQLRFYRWLARWRHYWWSRTECLSRRSFLLGTWWWRQQASWLWGMAWKGRW